MKEGEKEKSPAPTKQSVMFLLHNNGEVLLEKRLNPKKSYYGHLIIPGGKVDTEKYELPEDALAREVKEEHGVEVKVAIQLDEPFEDISPRGNHYLVHAYLVTVFEGEVREMEPEKASLVWVPIEQAKSLLKYANSRYVLGLAERHLIEEVQNKG